MLDWLSETAGPGYASALLWTLGALLLLIVVLVGIRIFRSMTFGTYVVGGRHRRHRLAVSDAAAVDSHRRLVLVRRDDVEHLILIGGPTDVVVEQNIRAAPAESNQTAAPASPVQRETAPPAAQRQPAPPPIRPAGPASDRPQPRPAAPVSVQPTRPVSAPPVRPAPAPPAPATRPAPPPVAPAVAVGAASAPQKPATQDIDSALLEELNVALDRPVGPKEGGDPTLEDEMSRLLGDLSDPRRA